MHNEKDVIYL